MRIIPMIGLHTDGSLTALEGPRDFRRQSMSDKEGRKCKLWVIYIHIRVESETENIVFSVIDVFHCYFWFVYLMQN